jgi:glycosyltransferase involved in cell wall biosynthesis
MTVALQSPSVVSNDASPPLDARVVLLTNFIPPHALPVYEELARRFAGFTVLLSTPMERNRSWAAEWGGLDVRLQRTLTIPRPWKHAAGFRDKLFIHVPWDTIPRLRQLRPDVVISSELGMRSLLSAIHKQTARDCRLVLWTGLSEHTEQGRGRARLALREWLLQRADAIAVNGGSGERYLASLGAAPERVFRVPYAAVTMDLADGQVSAPRSGPRRLLYVGQLIDRKGILPFTRALVNWAKDHADQRVAFTIVGSGPLLEPLSGLSPPDNLSIDLAGETSLSRIAEHYSQSDICVFPTLADEWGLVVNEAMAAGLPVLGSRFGQSAEELCIEGETGWLFRPTDAAEMEQAINRAISTPADRLAAMGRAARARVSHLTPRFAAERLVEAVRFALHPAEHRSKTAIPERLPGSSP